ncbi:unnamed protein product [Bursaphelenchus xylophilus]|uniref:(pine wood nematode) hypothetical protein n=1 Tax=Bursaphelenchus xylophilus TaxID=6326 RepID=A0A1I7SX26_BURXY|nr:unnamed protein product [Bursaphelenchus xylophilus]CAG9100130.1 unnamed protein product [Bursaphelenchus xylophilus]
MTLRIFSLALLLLLPLSTQSCAATRGGGGGASPSIDRCPTGPANTAGLTTNGVTLQNAGDTSNPVATSSSCTAGERNYWTSATSAQPDDDTGNAQKEIGVQCPTASSVCVCRCDGVCCQSGSTAPDTVSFFPFCSGGVCNSYAVLEGDNAASLTCSDGSTFTVASQSNADGSFKALTSGSYLEAASVSCNGCSSIQNDACTAAVSGSTPIS